MAEKTTLSRASVLFGPALGPALALALALALAWPASVALALSVEWKNLAKCERIVIRLDSADGRVGGVARTSPTSIGLPFSSGTRSFAMAAPGTAKLFGGVESAPGGLNVKLKSPEFGYIVTRPAANIVHLDIYPDPLGKRWKKPEPRAAAPAAAPKAPAAAPKAPAAAPKAPAAQAPASKTPEQPKAAPASGRPDPSSVFSGKIAQPDKAATQSAPAKTEAPKEQPGTAAPPPQQPGRIGSGLEEGDNYRLPEWPPLDMPNTLPAPPPPPSSNPGASLWPPVAPQSVSRNETGGASSVLEAPLAVKAARVFSWRDFLPLASVAHAAAPDGESDYETVEAPFAYRGVLNVADEPGWVEQPIPVYIRVPKGTAFDVRADAAPRAGAAPTPAPVAETAPPPTSGSSAPPPAPAPAPPGNVAEAPAGPAPASPVPATPAPAVPQSASPAPATPAPAASQSAPTSPAPAPAGSTQASPTPAAPAAPETPAASAVPDGQQASSAAEARAIPKKKASKEPLPRPAGSPPAPPGEAVMYVDEQGNPVEPPLDPTTVLRDIDRQMNDGAFAESIVILEKLLAQHNLSRQQREIALHRRADAVFSLHENDLAANLQHIVDTSTQAISFNTKSPRNAAAYLRLGYANLMAGNAYEAAGYFNVLRREYPHYENVPLTYYYWGDYQYTQGNMNEAIEQFNYIVNNYPEHPISRDASLGLARSYYRTGAFEDAFKIMLFVEQRWPNFYLDYPPMLSMMGDVAYRVGNLDKARSAYWMYYNLAPNAEDADMILTRLGDIYMAGKYHSAAVQVYSEAVKRFPSKDGGLISLMRLAEDGIYDEPTMRDMVKVFDRPYDKRPAEAYRTIIREYPGNPLVTLAKLKLAMWTLWQKDYITVLDLCSEIVGEAPSSPLAQRAREVAMNAFTLMAAADTGDKRYNRVREVWQRYPILQTQAEFLDPESRLALAVSQWNSGFNTEALATLEPFFYGIKAGEISEMALFLALNIMTEHYQWEQIEDLAKRVELWELTPQAQNQMNYALALAYENLGKHEAAAPLWSSIYTAKLLPPTQMANAAFYLARAAERRRDLESAYHIGQDAIKLLVGVLDTDPEHADLEKIKSQLMSLVDMAESSGVLQQALDYAQQYLKYVGEGSLDQQSVIYRIARIHKKRGDTADWLRILGDLADKYPDSVFGKTAKSELSAYRLGSEAQRFSNTQF